MNTMYQRTISDEEAREGYVFLLKPALGFFPAPGRPFEMKQGGTVSPCVVEARSCQCRGAGKPHSHYFFRWPSLQRGDMVVVQRDAKKATLYHVQIRSMHGQREFCG